MRCSWQRGPNEIEKIYVGNAKFQSAWRSGAKKALLLTGPFQWMLKIPSGRPGKEEVESIAFLADLAQRR